MTVLLGQHPMQAPTDARDDFSYEVSAADRVAARKSLLENFVGLDGAAVRPCLSEGVSVCACDGPCVCRLRLRVRARLSGFVFAWAHCFVLFVIALAFISAVVSLLLLTVCVAPVSVSACKGRQVVSCTFLCLLDLPPDENLTTVGASRAHTPRQGQLR